jgi:UDP-GlcNAc:undecaprenyl-phosphate GlcNAc-1-phosphate transferase
VIQAVMPQGLELVLLLLVGALALLLSLYGTPRMAEAARRFGIVDQPDGALKTHREPIPYLGGLAVFLAFLVALGLVYRWSPGLTGLLLAGSLVVMLGLIDDLGALSPGQKLAGQVLAAWILIKSQIMIQVGWLPPLAQAGLTVLWVVAMANAFNLIDIMDGLAAGVAAIAALNLTVIALLNHDGGVAAVAAALCGATAGFLRHNWHPANIYMGDAGSMFLGFMLAALSMAVRHADTNPLAVLNPLLLLAVPLFDMAFVTVVRLVKGLSPFRGSPDHVALRLRRRGLSVKETVSLAYAVAAVMGAAAMLNMELEWGQSLRLYVVVGAFLLGAAMLLARDREAA